MRCGGQFDLIPCAVAAFAAAAAAAAAGTWRPAIVPVPQIGIGTHTHTQAGTGDHDIVAFSPSLVFAANVGQTVGAHSSRIARA